MFHNRLATVFLGVMVWSSTLASASVRMPLPLASLAEPQATDFVAHGADAELVCLSGLTRFQPDSGWATWCQTEAFLCGLADVCLRELDWPVLARAEQLRVFARDAVAGPRSAQAPLLRGWKQQTSSAAAAAMWSRPLGPLGEHGLRPAQTGRSTARALLGTAGLPR